MRYAAPWDRTLRVSTIALLAAIAVATFAFLRFGAGTGRLGALVSVLVAGAMLVSVAVAWALSPKGFSIEGANVRIERGVAPVLVPLSEIRTVGLLPDGAIRGAARVGGSGGFFGYYGRFWSRRLGAFRAYATRGRGLVQLGTERDLFVLSPEPAERFVEEVLGRAPHAVRADPGAPAGRHALPRRTRIALALAIGLVPIAVAAVLAGSWAYRPRAAAVEGGAIRIERELAAPAVIPLGDVRAIEVLRPESLRGLRRVAGYAGVRVAYGHYRSDRLGDFQLYAWRRGPYVLLDTDRERIVLTPDEPERFVEAVRSGMPRSP